MPAARRPRNAAKPTDPQKSGSTDGAAAGADANGASETDERAARRGRLIIPNVGTGAKVSHDTLVSDEVLAEHDARDADRGDRAAAIFEAEGYDGTLTVKLFRRLGPLLREPINPRDIVTTGPADRGKPMVTTGIRSVQVQVDRLSQVLGDAHYRLIPHHTPDGQRCRMHVVIGNDLQWCRVDAAGELQPYTLLEGTVGGDGIAPYAGVKYAEVIAHADGWGGHARGSAPGDIWKGSETNAGKRVIARVGPGNHVYALDFEDDPQDGRTPPKQRAKAKTADAQATENAAAQAASGEPEATPEQHEAAIAAILAEEGPLQALRVNADKGMIAIGGSPARRHATLKARTTKAKLEDLITQIGNALNEEGEQQTFDGGTA